MCCSNRKRRRGFSLVEVMIVIVIIGMLAGVVTVNVRSYLVRAKQNTARQEISTIVQGLETFYATYDRYPTNEEGLSALVEPSERLAEPPLKGSGVLTDPWGQPYQYNSPGANGPYEVISYGADGRQGGEGADADIHSDELKEH